MRRARVAVTTAALLLGPVATTAFAGPGQETRTFTYSAAHFGYVNLQPLMPAGASPTGVLVFTPRHRTITLTIDDASVPDGQSIFVSRGGCIPVRTRTILTGFRPGVQVELMIYGDGQWLPGEPRPACTGHPTVGSAKVVL